MAELKIAAKDESLDTVNDFIHGILEPAGFSSAEMMQMDLAVEEIFVNIAHYAYAPGSGDVVVECNVSGEPPCATVSFSDSGVPFDPLKKEDPDVTLSAEERKIGGLGIFLVKKYMDNVKYDYRDGKNILTMSKSVVNK